MEVASSISLILSWEMASPSPHLLLLFHHNIIVSSCPIIHLDIASPSHHHSDNHIFISVITPSPHPFPRIIVSTADAHASHLLMILCCSVIPSSHHRHTTIYIFFYSNFFSIINPTCLLPFVQKAIQILFSPPFDTPSQALNIIIS